eukprot:5937519-Amphidinium_carterae.1
MTGPGYRHTMDRSLLFLLPRQLRRQNADYYLDLEPILTVWRTDCTTSSFYFVATRKTGGETFLGEDLKQTLAWDTGKWAGYRSFAGLERPKHQDLTFVVSILVAGV